MLPDPYWWYAAAIPGSSARVDRYSYLTPDAVKREYPEGTPVAGARGHFMATALQGVE